MRSGDGLNVRAPRRLAATAAVCLFALAANGCSVLFAAGPPANHAEQLDFDCSSGYGAPRLDTGLAIGGAAGTVMLYGLAAGLSAFSGGREPEWVLLAGVPLVVLPVSSAVYGYRAVGDCREAKAELMRRLDRRAGRPPKPYDVEPPPPTIGR